MPAPAAILPWLPVSRAAPYAIAMAAIDQLVEELERSYKETQERLSDPAVYNDHTEAARSDAG